MLRTRLWEDGAYGTLSSDGRCVFSIEDMTLERDNNGNMPFGWGLVMNRNVNQGPCNHLAGRDIHRTASWFRRSRGAPRVARTGPCGRPVPFSLVHPCLARTSLRARRSQRQIRRLALDAETGNTLWSQELAVVQHNFAPDSQRRSVACRPPMPTGSSFARPAPAAWSPSTWRRTRCDGATVTATAKTPWKSASE